MTQHDFFPQINTRTLKKLLIEGSQRKPSTAAMNLNRLIIATARLINKDLSEGTFHLDLSDKRLEREIHCSTRQAKTIRVKLQSLGIIYIPEGQKQKGAGTYPNWLLKIDDENKQKGVIEIIEFEKQTSKRRKIAPVNTRFDTTYCDLYYEALREIMPIEAWSIKDRMIAVHQYVNAELEIKGLTRDDCRI